MDINPFPQYPVSQLSENPADIDQRTWVTEPIRQERAVIANWIERPDKPLIVAVLGDYGSGKTHLLLDAMATLGSRCDAVGRPYSCLPVVALAESPLGWYRAEIGPKLASLPLADVVRMLWAEAGKEVAGRAGLTGAAVATLDRNPEQILKLVREDLLSPTDVEAVFQARLEEAVPGASPGILRALGLLRRHEADEALRWLAGGELAQDQAARLQLPASIGTDEHAMQAVLAVAAIYDAVGRVFALFIDEAEHFLRTEEGRDQNPNVTTLKRLLEGLAQRHAVAFVAGHSSAWETLRDYHDRFSPAAPIDIETLTGEQVRHLVATRVPSAPDFGAEQSALVARLGQGNMRSITSLLRELYEQSAGLARPLSPGQIEAVAEALGKRPKPETIILRVHALLESFGFTVARRRWVASSEFDLVAFHGNRPRVLVRLQHASHEIVQGSQVRLMIEEMGMVNEQYPEAVGCFLAEGRLDESIQELLAARPDQRIVFAEVTDPDFLVGLAGELRPLLAATVTSATSTRAEHSRRTVIRQLGQLQSDRGQQLDAFLGTLPENVGPAPSRADYQDRRTAIYEELTRPVSRASLFAGVWGVRTVFAAFLVVFGIFAAIFTGTEGSIIRGFDVNYPLVTALQYLVAFVLFSLGLFFGAHDLIRVQGFYDYRNRRLRSLYLRGADSERLIEEHDLLQKAIDGYGPRWRFAALDDSFRREDEK